MLDKQSCIWEGGKSHTCSDLPLPHNSPVFILHLLVAKPAFLSRLAMHKIAFCSPSHIKAPSRYADRSSREWRKLTNPPRLFLLKLAPQPIGSVSFHRTQTLTSLWKTPHLSRLCQQPANTTRGWRLWDLPVLLKERKYQHSVPSSFHIYFYLPITHCQLRNMQLPYWIKTGIFQSSMRSWTHLSLFYLFIHILPPLSPSIYSAPPKAVSSILLTLSPLCHRAFAYTVPLHGALFSLG